MTRRSHTGATTVEFAIAAFLVVLPLIFATVELALLLVSRHQLTFATFMSARAGATSAADDDVMKRELIHHLAPLYARHGVARASTEAFLDLARPGRLHLRVLSPNAQTFWAWGTPESGHREIPNLITARDVHTTRRGISLVEANELRVESAMCKQLLFPLTRSAFLAFARASAANSFAASCLAASQLPIVSSAAVPMQSPARSDRLGIHLPP